jgi:hypothetical protein
MLVVTQEGISRRLGVGQVFEEVWERLSPLHEKFIVE